MKLLIILGLAIIGTQASVIDPVGTVELHYPEASEIDIPESPVCRAVSRNFVVGNTAGNRQLYSVIVSRNPSANQVQWADVVYRTNSALRIFAAQALHLTPQGATIRVVAGGIGQDNMTLRIQSARGRGFFYNVSFWGR